MKKLTALFSLMILLMNSMAHAQEKVNYSCKIYHTRNTPTGAQKIIYAETKFLDLEKPKNRKLIATVPLFMDDAAQKSVIVEFQIGLSLGGNVLLVASAHQRDGHGKNGRQPITSWGINGAPSFFQGYLEGEIRQDDDSAPGGLHAEIECARF